jgi:hypothetical protein
MRCLIAYLRGWIMYTRDPVGLCPYESQSLADSFWDGWYARKKHIEKKEKRNEAHSR